MTTEQTDNARWAEDNAAAMAKQPLPPEPLAPSDMDDVT